MKMDLYIEFFIEVPVKKILRDDVQEKIFSFIDEKANQKANFFIYSFQSKMKQIKILKILPFFEIF